MTKSNNKERSYWIVRGILRFLFRNLIQVDVVGQEHFEVDGACLIVANHLSVLDLPLILTYLPRRGWGLAAEAYRRHLLFGPILHFAGVIFVKREAADRQAIRAMLKVLQAGGTVGIHPEGTRSKTHQLRQARDGVAYLASRTEATIIPVAVSGSEKVIDALRKLRREHVRIVIGSPFKLPPTNGRAKGPQLTTYTDLIMCRLATLLPDSYRGYYRDRCETD